MLNVAPEPDGKFPVQFQNIMSRLGEWLKINGEAIYGSKRGNIVEFSTRGFQIVKNNSLYLVLSFWNGRDDSFTLTGLGSKVIAATLLGSSQKIAVCQKGDVIVISSIPAALPCRTSPVIRLDCESAPKACGIHRWRLWDGDASRMSSWARTRRHGAKISDYAK